jgi:hypothetical protein
MSSAAVFRDSRLGRHNLAARTLGCPCRFCLLGTCCLFAARPHLLPLVAFLPTLCTAAARGTAAFFSLSVCTRVSCTVETIHPPRPLLVRHVTTLRARKQLTAHVEHCNDSGRNLAIRTT